MPQLLPFYYVSQLTWTLAAFFIIAWIISIYILPSIVHLFTTRVYVTKI